MLKIKPVFRNFLTTTFRNLRKNRGYSILNIFGLAVGIACAGFIFLWVEDEINFDNFNTNKGLIYLVKTNDQLDNGVFTHSSTPGPAAATLEASFPGIASTSRATERSTVLLSSGDKSLDADGEYVEPSFFDIFTLPFAEGNATEAFSQLHSLVITRKTARKFFGSGKNALGKTLRMDNRQDYVVTGVLKDLPENSTLQFDWLAPFQVWYQANPRASRWFYFGLNTYVELTPGADAVSINRKLLNPYYDLTTQKIEKDKSSVHVFLFGMKDWHLRNEFAGGKPTGGGRIEYVRLFSLIAWIIVLIACINFMNLATAGSESRSKEIGVRKVLGSGRKDLVLRFIGESVFMAVIAAIAAVVLMSLLLPAFNSLVQKNLSLGLNRPSHIAALAGITIVCGLVAGSYPSFYLSSFNPVFVLKGIRAKSGSATLIRKALVITQFSISIILVISTIVIYEQVQHVKNRNLGYDKGGLLRVAAEGNLVKHFPAIKQDLLNTGFVSEAALADYNTLDAGNNSTSISWPGKDPASNVVISQRLVSEGYLKTTGLHLVEGRNFQPEDEVKLDSARPPENGDQAFNVIITRSLEKLMGKGSAVGGLLEQQNESATFRLRVVGVVRDYVYGDMYGTPAPVIFYDIPGAATLLFVRIAGRSREAVARIGAVLKKDNPAYPFQYQFVDDQFNRLFVSEMLISKLSRVFASLAILISCLGLFGLAAFSAERKTKEIGVRKVLGATVRTIVTLLTFDFLKLVLISCCISFPLAWVIMNNWLHNYSYRIHMSWWIFLISGLVATIVALLATGSQAVKAAMANPVESLRTE